jgi:uncharacterized protein DUF3224
MPRAVGTYDITLSLQTAPDAVPGRYTIDKQLHGDLEAVSTGEMLTAMTAVSASAGYVAIEKVTGTLDGRSGSFVLQHSGISDRGTLNLNITVVPDSGTGQLEGLAGRMTIRIGETRHDYEFEYTLPGGE